jgi:hypothetical protein
MTFPSGQVIQTTSLDTSTAKPSDARVDLLLAVQTINTIVADANTASGVVVLNGAGELPSGILPSTYAPSGDLVLAPTSGTVKIQDVLRLQQLTTTQILALATPVIGDIALVTDSGASDLPAICFYDGTNWKFLAFSGLTTLA